VVSATVLVVIIAAIIVIVLLMWKKGKLKSKIRVLEYQKSDASLRYMHVICG